MSIYNTTGLIPTDFTEYDSECSWFSCYDASLINGLIICFFIVLIILIPVAVCVAVMFQKKNEKMKELNRQIEHYTEQHIIYRNHLNGIYGMNSNVNNVNVNRNVNGNNNNAISCNVLNNNGMPSFGTKLEIQMTGRGNVEGAPLASGDDTQSAELKENFNDCNEGSDIFDENDTDLEFKQKILNRISKYSSPQVADGVKNEIMGNTLLKKAEIIDKIDFGSSNDEIKEQLYPLLGNDTPLECKNLIVEEMIQFQITKQ